MLIQTIYVTNHSDLLTVNQKYKIAAKLCNNIPQINIKVVFYQIKGLKQLIVVLKRIKDKPKYKSRKIHN